MIITYHSLLSRPTLHKGNERQLTIVLYSEIAHRISESINMLKIWKVSPIILFIYHVIGNQIVKYLSIMKQTLWLMQRFTNYCQDRQLGGWTDRLTFPVHCLAVNQVKCTIFLIGVSHYIDILQYTKNLYRMAIRNLYRNLS